MLIDKKLLDGSSLRQGRAKERGWIGTFGQMRRTGRRGCWMRCCRGLLLRRIIIRIHRRLWYASAGVWTRCAMIRTDTRRSASIFARQMGRMAVRCLRACGILWRFSSLAWFSRRKTAPMVRTGVNWCRLLRWRLRWTEAYGCYGRQSAVEKRFMSRKTGQYNLPLSRIASRQGLFKIILFMICCF